MTQKTVANDDEARSVALIRSRIKLYVEASQLFLGVVIGLGLTASITEKLRYDAAPGLGRYNFRVLFSA